LLRKAEEWLLGKGVLTIGTAAQAEETLASDGEEELARLVSATGEGLRKAIAGTEPPIIIRSI
jgi:tRNA G18 (ribose-2'-O)-methylase SpoU